MRLVFSVINLCSDGERVNGFLIPAVDTHRDQIRTTDLY